MAGFAQKVVIVTGASSGIGRATAERFAKHGTFLTITGRDKTKLDEVTKACLKNGAKDVLPIIAEFTNLSEIDAVINRTIEKYKRIDILVNNAGYGIITPLQTSTMEDFDTVFNVNVKSVFRLTQLAMPHLVESKGNIVNVSSICSRRQYPNLLLYGMTKASLDQFTKTVALQYAPKGVRVNAVNPAVVKTEIYRHRFDSEQHQKYYSKQGPAHPIGRIGTVEEVAAAILFLASDDSAWTTGRCLVLDGGRILTSNL